MTDTSLISSETGETPEGADTNANNAADQEGRSEQTVVDEMYPSHKEGDEKPNDNSDPKNEDQSNEEGDKPSDDTKDQDEGDDKSKDKPKDEKKDDDKASDDKDNKEADEDKDKGEPVDLSDIEVDLPEGIELNQEAMEELGVLAGELNLSKEDATKFVPIGTKLIEHAFEKQQESYNATREEWRDTVASDKEIGGPDEAARKEKIAVANKGLKTFGTPELRTLLDQTGLGDHPEVIRAFYKVGLTASEDVVEQGGSGDTAAKGLDAMYPSMAKNK